MIRRDTDEIRKRFEEINSPIPGQRSSFADFLSGWRECEAWIQREMESMDLGASRAEP